MWFYLLVRSCNYNWSGNGRPGGLSEKLYRSTDISAASLDEVGYDLVHPDVAEACQAWAAAVDPATGAATDLLGAPGVPA